MYGTAQISGALRTARYDALVTELAIAAANPFATEIGRAESCYTAFRDEKLVVARNGDDAPPLAQRVHAAFRALVLDPEFPCVGARSALNQNSYRFGMYGKLNSTRGTAGLAHDLYEFVQEQPDIAGEFNSFIACFDKPKVQDDRMFETLLWQQLERLHDLDRPHFEWDADVSKSPDDPRFSFSFGGCAFFIVGLAPSGSRWARQFPWATMVFNSHEQFERLRDNGQFARLQAVIRERDTELQGDINPNLANFGEHTEAKQYSGREVEPNWRCPAIFD